MKIQKDGESFEQFVTDLRLLIKECNYPEDILDDMVRDHIVFGVRSVKLCEKFISEGNGLTLQKSLDIARTYELTKSRIQQMDNNKSVNAVTPRTYHHPEAKRNPKQRSRGKLKYSNAGTKKATCSNCGSKHETKDICPARGKDCLDTCLAMNLLNFVSAVEPDVSYTKDQVISKYHDVFTGLGTLPGECDIHIKSDAIPVVHPPRRVSIAIKERLKTELDRMVQDKVIVKVTAPSVWVNSMVTVEKPNGSLRVCLDPKDLNEAIVGPHYSSRSIDDILPDLTGATVFSKFDARTGYRRLRPENGVLSLNGVKVIVDDIVCYGKDKQEHDRNLDKLMERCQQKGLKFNADKTEIDKSEIPFFGHLLTSDGLKIDPSKDIPVADTLSRNYLQDEQIDVCKDIDVHVHSVMENIAMSDQKMTLIKSKIETDQEMQTLKHTILTGWPDKRQTCPNSILQYWNFRDELTVIDDFLLKGNNVIIPKDLRRMMLDKVYDSHLGIEKCTQRARSVMFWPNMTKDIKNKVLNCPICLEHRNSNVKEPMIPNQIPSRPWEVVATDIFHWNDSNYIVVVDLYSRYFECGLLRNMRTDTVIHKLKGYFAAHGISSKVISDNAGQYCSQEFDKFAREWDFEHVTSSPLHSQGNGVAEKCIQTIKKMFTKSLQDNKDPYLAVLEYRNAPLSCGKSPVQLLMSRETRSILPVTRKHLEPKVQNRQEIKSKMSKSKIKSKTWFDKSAKPLTQLSQGETIRIKQGKRWKQAIVRKQVHDRSYIVETNDGGVYRRNRNHLLKTNEKPFQIIDTHPCNGNDIRLTDQSQHDSDRNIQNQSERNFSHDNTQSQQQQPSPPTDVAGNTDQNSNMYVTRSGRQVKVPQRLDL
ncbi:uncharacterized protein K02A2.6-like [Mya arenaria]|uniref:uncharacterized protein K02A2.6-like n=1 Tax=Mya arenaria TaxID=6604 RepID=UPI0022E295F6|nr:uncharacterized protein K02A2.6-like [Mya arenaria]